MFNRNINLLFLFLAVLNEHATAWSDDEFNLLIFVQRWPPTICKMWKKEFHSCTLPKNPKEWTIHGLWPSKYHKIGPGFCNPSLPFDPNALSPLVDQLKEKWIDIEYGRESYSLWKHEWNKHGTCAAVLPQLNSERKYFEEGLALLSQYDMKNVLAQANIVPGYQYAATDIFNEVEQVLGARPVIACRRDGDTGDSYLFEIRICLDKALKLTNCDGVYEFPTNCEATNVIYPADASQDYNEV